MAYYPRLFGAIFLQLTVRHCLAQTCWRSTPCSSVETAAFPGEWESSIFAPSSRTVTPSAIRDTASGVQINTWPAALHLDSEKQPSVVFDFGLEVGGIITLNYTVSTVTGDSAIGLAFTEAWNYVGSQSDNTTGDSSRADGAIYSNFSRTGDVAYVMPDERLRSGFRYLTLFLQGGEASVQIRNISLELSFQPTWSNLRAYQGYFHSSDKLLNRIWYSGAYTIQLDAVHPSTGKAWPAPATAWENNAQLGPGETILVDGAKRDRTVWPGDIGVAAPAAFYSTGDLESTKNSLQSLYDYQNATTGELPFSGIPLSAAGSDSYHLWTMIGTYNYVFYADDVNFLSTNWDKYKLAMTFALGQIDSSGLFYGDSPVNDWGRLHANGTLTSLQAIFYRTLVTGAELANWAGDTTGVGASWLQQASTIQALANSNNWDAGAGAFWDTAERTDIHPQDGNSLAVYFGLVNDSSRAASISTYLTKNWTPIGPECEELPSNVSPFISSFEVQAHLLAGEPGRALDLIRTSWGWYLDHPNGTQSSMIEGYLVDGTWGYRSPDNAGYGGDYSFTSHAHGWATGPVTALTERVVGLSITGRAGATWRLAPQIDGTGLRHAEAGFTTKLGKFQAGWTVADDGSVALEYSVPDGTTGEVVLHTNGTDVVVNGRRRMSRFGAAMGGKDGRGFIVIPSNGGKYSFVFR